MSGLFGGGGTVTPPKPKPAPPVPTVGEEVGDIARRTRPRGREETFLTGDLVPKFTGKKKRLA